MRRSKRSDSYQHHRRPESHHRRRSTCRSFHPLCRCRMAGYYLPNTAIGTPCRRRCTCQPELLFGKDHLYLSCCHMALSEASVHQGHCRGSSQGMNRQASLRNWSVPLSCSPPYPVSGRHGPQNSNHLLVAILDRELYGSGEECTYWCSKSTGQ